MTCHVGRHVAFRLQNTLTKQVSALVFIVCLVLFVSPHLWTGNVSPLRSTSYLTAWKFYIMYMPLETYIIGNLCFSEREELFEQFAQVLIGMRTSRTTFYSELTLSFNKKGISPALIFVLIPLPHSPSGRNLEVIAEILLRTLRNSTNHIMNVVTQKLKSHAHAGGVFDSSYKAFGNRGKSFVFSTCSYL